MKIDSLLDAKAWSRVIVYTKALMEDMKTVWALSMTKACAAMIWGGFNTTDLLMEYTRLCWNQHPQVSSILALTSLQNGGQGCE